MHSRQDKRMLVSRASAKTALLAVLAVLCTVNTRAETEIAGLDEIQESNVRALMPLASTGCDSAHWRVERLFRDADGNITEALQALGYYEPTISKQLSWSEDCWLAQFDIQAGTPVRIREVDVAVFGAAATDTDYQSRLKTPAPASGDILNHGLYDSYKAAMLRAAINTGYFDADFERSEVVVDPAAEVADVNLQLNSGVKYSFGSVNFTTGILRRGLLQRYTDIKPGDPYSAKAINDLYEALNGSSYFKTVSISTEPLDTTAKSVPVTVNLTPANRRVYSVGLGFTTDTGPHGRLGFSDRRRNDKGHQLESKLYVSPVISELNAAYRWPRNDPRREWFSVVAGAKHEKTDTSESDTFKVGVLRTRNVGSAWLETRYIDYASENFVVGDQDTSSQLIIFGTNYETAKGRALSRASNGYRLSFDLRGASDSFGSDTSFLQLRSKAKWVSALGEKTRFLAQADIGVTKKDEVSELPASVRFFAGGDRSVRGYEFESLGPTNDDGEVIGGSHLFAASLEIDYLFKPQWAVAAFADIGNAFNETDYDLKVGIGIGVRWYSPVGPIRLDFAHPLDDPDEDVRIHISLGPDL
jgi:translocation and assembly module TamA